MLTLYWLGIGSHLLSTATQVMRESDLGVRFKATKATLQILRLSVGFEEIVQPVRLQATLCGGAKTARQAALQ
eukprot:3899822-Amphidinium_carterae.1